ncbi:deoxyribodipyrimidine photo-lyase [Brevibacterium sp. BDJS002]|uniref:cryptochrome/photolyase family protein n=1 Tax=Brevibacterium sp. BDJS002 TaxID=3020906 RepID=UPI002307F1E7|nr:deoxyribodipyrimidine photo-lyase [Brevibacterium sp. BDJS002]WCE39393.1 deoxyribodipyrimidine photo-lyase [Brevibacterium sp. BDJS002]
MGTTDEDLTLVWFRDDLRVSDHGALTAARADGRVIAVWIREARDSQGLGPRPLGGASRWWAHESLAILHQELSDLGIPLLFAAGEAAAIIPQLTGSLGVGAVRWSRRYAPASRALDSQIKTVLHEQGLAVHSHTGSLLVEPWTAAPQGGDHYKVFTPFWKAVSGREVGDVLPTPEPQSPIDRSLVESARDCTAVTDLDGLGLLDGTGTGSGHFAAVHGPRWWQDTIACHWLPGTRAAADQLDDLAVGIDGYSSTRDVPSDANSTSRLSPRLRFGELSPRQLLHAAQTTRSVTPDDRAAWVRQLYWREFSWHLTYHYPDIDYTPIRREFRNFPYEDDDEALAHWRSGATGYPLIDAGMAQLWETGWMHNRVRMVTASFLTKNLLQHWWCGEQWFWDALVDADEANNPVSWQWVAGSGADAAPYFRVFNPERQRERFDPDGAYVDDWLPYPPAAAPAPIVDLADSRQAALSAYDRMKNMSAGAVSAETVSAGDDDTKAVRS